MRHSAPLNASVPDCLATNYEKLANSIELPDPDDRHMVAAAIVGHADVIVTFNTKDFPQPYCSFMALKCSTPTSL